MKGIFSHISPAMHPNIVSSKSDKDKVLLEEEKVKNISHNSKSVKAMETLSLKTSNHRSRRLSRNKFLRQPSFQLGLSLYQVGLSNADVTFVSQSAKATAVKKGTGVMIGDYFVGVTTGADLLFSQSIIVY